MICHKVSQIEVDADAFRFWRGGTHIQTAFPEMSAPERERLKTGTHPKCWDTMFGGMGDDDAT
jgi:hypothetical protein